MSPAGVLLGVDAMIRSGFVPCLFLMAAPAVAAPAPRIDSVTPFLLQRGAATEVTVRGTRLAGVASVHFAGEGGLTAAVEPSGDKPNPTSRRIKLTVAPDAPTGVREVRLVAPDGVSNPLPMEVGVLPVALEKEPNNTPLQAQKIEIPAAIVGEIHAPLEIDHFRFHAKKGQHVIADVYANRIGTKLDASAALFDAAGTEIARSEDVLGLDPLLEYDVPADGDYVLALRDYLHQGGPKEYAYRAEVGVIPYVESFFPLGGPRGRPVTIGLSGRNLDGTASIQIALDPKSALGRREIRAETSLGPSQAIPFVVGDLPEIADAEPNDARDKAQPVSPPVTINGRLDPAGDVDTFRFRADAHTNLVIEVAAFRFGSPLDALLTLSDAHGKALQFSDDAVGADARIEAKDLVKDAEYFVSVRDLLERGGERFAYRLSIEPPRPEPPGFTARFLPDALRVGRGSQAKAWCEVMRQGGFAGDVTLSFPDLPPGVTCEPLVVPGDRPTSGLFTIASAPDAPTGTVPIRVVATGRVGDEARAVTADPERDNRTTRQAFVTVLDAPPFTVESIGAAPGDESAKSKREELAQLEKSLATQTPELDAAQAEWERRLPAESSWTVFVPEKISAHGGATLMQQQDGAILVGGSLPTKDTFTLIGRTDLRGITAFRLEVLPDPSLPASGPGRAGSGNFVLTEFRVQTVSGQSMAAQTVAFRAATVDHAQDEFPIANAIDGKSDTGWAIAPQFGVPHTAIFETAAPVGAEGGVGLTFTLEQQSIVHTQHLIGRFRLSATTASKPTRGIVTLPAGVRAILQVPPERRAEAQKAELATYFRSIAPELKVARDRAMQLRAETAEYPPQAQRDALATVGVAIRRREGFAAPIQVSLEGFSAGRDPQTRQPALIAKDLDVKPITFEGDRMYGALEVKPKAEADVAARNVVVKATAVAGGETIAQYSRAFPFTTYRVRPLGPPRAPENPANVVGGLDSAYYEGTWTQLPDFAALQPVKTGPVAGFDIGTRNRNDMFGFVFSGLLDVPKDGVYSFYLKSDDGSRLAMGSTVVVDHDGLHGPTEKEGAIELKAGRHAIAVSFFEREGSESLEVLWEGPGIPKQPIPATALFRSKPE